MCGAKFTVLLCWLMADFELASMVSLAELRILDRGAALTCGRSQFQRLNLNRHAPHSAPTHIMASGRQLLS